MTTPSEPTGVSSPVLPDTAHKSRSLPGGQSRAPVSAGHRTPPFAMEALVGHILLVGVLTSIGLIVAGLAWHWARTGQVGIDYSIAGVNFFEFLTASFRQVAGDELRPRLLVSLGIASLLLTPFVRVLASLVYFVLAARNWKYAAFTAFVLGVLTYSLFLR